MGVKRASGSRKLTNRTVTSEGLSKRSWAVCNCRLEPILPSTYSVNSSSDKFNDVKSELRTSNESIAHAHAVVTRPSFYLPPKGLGMRLLAIPAPKFTYFLKVV